MTRAAGVAVFVLLATGCAPRRSLGTIPVGAQIRVTVDGGTRVVGTLLAPLASPDSVVRYGSGGIALSTHLASVRRLEVRDHTARRGFARGAILGGLLASAVWATRAKSRCEPATCQGVILRAAIDAAPFGAVYGAVTGAVAGAFHAGWSRRWP